MSCTARRARLRREMNVAHRRIDQLVYELYGLTGAEIRLVEAATAGTPSPAENEQIGSGAQD